MKEAAKWLPLSLLFLLFRPVDVCLPPEGKSKNLGLYGKFLILNGTYLIHPDPVGGNPCHWPDSDIIQSAQVHHPKDETLPDA